MFVTEIEVRPTEIDSFGHVNNSRYLEYLEHARYSWSASVGLSYATFIESGIIPAVVEAKLRFHHESRLGDTLTIHTRPDLVHSARINFHHEIFNQNKVLVLRAVIAVIAVDMESRTFSEFPPHLVSAVKALMGLA